LRPKLIFILLFLIIASCKKENDSYIPIQAGRLLDKIESGNADKFTIEDLDSICEDLMEKNNDAMNRELLFKTSGIYYEFDQYDKYLSTTRKIHQLALQANDTAHTAKALYFIGDYFEKELQIDSAFKYYSKAEKLYRKIEDILNTGRTTLYKAGILYDAGIFTESEIQTAQALHFLIESGNNRLIYESYNLMGLNLKELNNDEGSLKYFNLALDQLDIMEKSDYDKGKLLRSRASICNNMGSLYKNMKNFPEAIQLYQKGLDTKDLKSGHPILYAMLLNNLAEARSKLGHDGQETERLILEALKIREENNFEAGIVNSRISLGEFYLLRNDTAKGIASIKEGYDLAKKIKSSYDSKKALQLLSESDIRHKDHYNTIYKKLSDSLYDLERKTKDKFARIAYETNQVEKTNQILSKRNRNLTIVAAAIILASGILLIIYRLRSKNRQLLLLKRQNEANEKIYQLIIGQHAAADRVRAEERNRIAMELHDGIVNRIFTTRFNLMQLQPEQGERKEQLVQELIVAETEIRKVSHDLQQGLLFNDDSFQKTVSSLVESQQNEFDTEFDLSIDKYIDWSLVSSEQKIHVYRIIQEAIQNINKHARAKKTDIMLLKTGKNITLRIWDDGIGFNPEKARNGIGLKNIRQRTLALKGELKIISNREDGTRLEIVF